MECKQVLYKSYQCVFSNLNGCWPKEDKWLEGKIDEPFFKLLHVRTCNLDKL